MFLISKKKFSLQHCRVRDSSLRKTLHPRACRVLEGTVQNIVAIATWRPGLMHPSLPTTVVVRSLPRP
jgi:hypothetical protein